MTERSSNPNIRTKLYILGTVAAMATTALAAVVSRGDNKESDDIDRKSERIAAPPKSTPKTTGQESETTMVAEDATTTLKPSIKKTETAPKPAPLEVPNQTPNPNSEVVVKPPEDNQPELTKPKVDLRHYQSTPEAAAWESKVTAWLDDPTMSAGLIGDASGNPVALVTAAHGFASNPNNDRYARGSGTINMDPLTIYQGNQFGEDVRPMDVKADRLILPIQGNNSKDVALSILQGETPEEAISRYKASSLTKEQVRSLKVGQRVDISGFPQSQPKNEGSPRRQNFPMTLAGWQEGVDVSSGQKLDVIWVAGQYSADGAGCTKGFSGAMANIGIEETKPDGTTETTYKSAGVVSAGAILNSDQDREAWGNRLGVNLNGWDFLCAVSYNQPDLNDGYEVVAATRQ